jgi:hypothetical protein
MRVLALMEIIERLRWAVADFITDDARSRIVILTYSDDAIP